MRVPIYRPEITVYERTAKNREWAIDGWVSRMGTVTNTLFYPMPDDDGSVLTEAGFKRVVAHGTEPFQVVIAPAGSEMIERGRAMFLRTPDGKFHDATNALINGKRGWSGFDLVRARTPAIVRQAPPPPMPVASKGPAKQLSMFG